jgi:hypothetical protein
MLIPFHKDSRFIVLSDCHRGDGTAGDEFARNSLIYKCALEHYLKEDFTYIELGDAEELWENDAFAQIYITHTSVYDLLLRFHDPDPARTRYLKVWGNHDEDWRDNLAPLRTLFSCIQINGDILGRGKMRDCALFFGEKMGRCPVFFPGQNFSSFADIQIYSNACECRLTGMVFFFTPRKLTMGSSPGQMPK